MAESLTAGPLAPLRTFTNQVTSHLRAARKELTGAAAARFATLLVLHPLDATKVRQQVTSARSHAAIKAATQGPWFKGVIAAAAGHVPYGVITFGVFAALKQRYSEKGNLDPRLTTLLAALSADVVGAFWLVPMETAKLRMQTGVCSSVLSAIRAGGVYNGFVSQVLRDAPFRAMYLVGYEVARSAWREKAGREISGKEGIALGAGVGALVGGLTTPLDVVKSRVMSQRVGAGRAYRGWFSCLRRTVKAEGSSALLRGFAPRVVYMAASVAMFSVAYEYGRRYVKEDVVASRDIDDHRVKRFGRK